MYKKQHGAAVVELALVIPLLLAITFIITEFGRAIYVYNSLAKSTRSATRYLTANAPGDASAQQVARNLIAYGKPNPLSSDSPLFKGINSSNVASYVLICDASNAVNCPNNLNQGSYPTINTVTVTIHGYNFIPIADIFGMLRFYGNTSKSISSIAFSDISVTMRQQ